MNGIFEILTYFLIYSFLGWIMESIVRTICEKKLINTGFLYGPVCPIYGIGAIIMLIFLDNFQNKPVLLFFISIIILTIWEYIVGVMLEKIFKTKYWDYSDQKFNFQGRICLVNSICWGVLGVLFVKYIHPLVLSLVSKVDTYLLYYIIGILLIVIIVDIIISVIRVKSMKSTLEKIEQLNKEIKEKLKELKVIKREKNKVTSAESVQEIIEQLKKKRNRIIIHLYRHVYRLKKAFPDINTKEISQILNKKMDKYKQKRKKSKNT